MNTCIRKHRSEISRSQVWSRKLWLALGFLLTVSPPGLCQDAGSSLQASEQCKLQTATPTPQAKKSSWPGLLTDLSGITSALLFSLYYRNVEAESQQRKNLFSPRPHRLPQHFAFPAGNSIQKMGFLWFSDCKSVPPCHLPLSRRTPMGLVWFCSFITLIGEVLFPLPSLRCEASPYLVSIIPESLRSPLSMTPLPMLYLSCPFSQQARCRLPHEGRLRVSIIPLLNLPRTLNKDHVPFNPKKTHQSPGVGSSCSSLPWQA